MTALQKALATRAAGCALFRPTGAGYRCFAPLERPAAAWSIRNSAPPWLHSPMNTARRGVKNPLLADYLAQTCARSEMTSFYSNYQYYFG